MGCLCRSRSFRSRRATAGVSTPSRRWLRLLSSRQERPTRSSGEPSSGLKKRCSSAWRSGMTASVSPPTGAALPAPSRIWTVSRVIPSLGRGFTVALRLSDGRWVVARHHRQIHGPGGALAVLLLLAVAVALGAYPRVRRLTGRVERLQRQIEALGALPLLI